MKKTNLPFSLSMICLISAMFFPASVHALTEVYKGQSEIGDEGTGRACMVTLDRDDKSKNILSLKIEAPARMIKYEVGEADEMVLDITPGKEGRDLSRSKKFSEFHFQRLADLQGEGFMLQGEKIDKSKKDEKLFLHFDVQDHNLVGVQFEQRESRATAKVKAMASVRAPVKVSLEKICTSLKKL